MNIKELVGLVYGVFMGTSTIYVKTSREHEFPEKIKKVGSFDLIIGGQRNQIFNQRLSIDANVENQREIAISTILISDRPGVIQPGKAEYQVANVTVRSVGSRNLVVWLPEVKALALGDLFFNRVHPPIKELQLPNASVLKEILENLKNEFHPDLYIPAEGEPATSFEEFLTYLADLADLNQEFATLNQKYSHFQEIVGLSSFSENFDYLRR